MKDRDFIVNEIDYSYDVKAKGYIIAIPEGLSKKEVYFMLKDLRDNILKGHKLYTIGELTMIKNHCKFYKRFGNKVIYEYRF